MKNITEAQKYYENRLMLEMKEFVEFVELHGFTEHTYTLLRFLKEKIEMVKSLDFVRKAHRIE